MFEDPGWRVTEDDDGLVFLPGGLQCPLEPVPLVGRVVVVVVPGLHVGLQVEGRVDGHQLELPAGQVDLVKPTGLQSLDGFGWEPSLPELARSQVHRLLLLSRQIREEIREEEYFVLLLFRNKLQNCIRAAGYVIQSTREDCPGQIEFGKIVFLLLQFAPVMSCLFHFNCMYYNGKYASLASACLRFRLTGRIEVLVAQDGVDGGVGELLPHEDGHLLQVSGGVVVPHPLVRPAISGTKRER